MSVAPVRHFSISILEEGPHTSLNCIPADSLNGRLLRNQPAHGVVVLQDLVKGNPSLVPRVVAGIAAGSAPHIEGGSELQTKLGGQASLSVGPVEFRVLIAEYPGTRYGTGYTGSGRGAGRRCREERPRR